MRLILAIMVALVVVGWHQNYSIQKCMRGPTLKYQPRSCIEYDLDNDGDVDLLDWADWVIENPEASQF